MTKLHKAEGGVFTRCRATVMQGHGVTDCPLEVDGVEVRHVVGLKGIAEAGGGIMRKPLGNGRYRDTYVMGLPDGGYMTSTGQQERIYDRTGKLVPELERRRQRRREQREGQLPELNAMEQWQVDEEYAELREAVTNGLRDWGTSEGEAFRQEAMTAASAAEKKLYAPATLALLLEVSSRHNAPEELKPALGAVKRDVTDAPEPRAYLIQKAREEKRERFHGPAVEHKLKETAVSLTPEDVRQQGALNAKTAPYDLRRFFIIDEDDDGNESIWFSSRSAYRRLIGAELGDDLAEAIEDAPAGLALRDGLKRLSDTDFENDAAWQSSDERRVMASEVPELLARLEDQAEEAAIYRMLHG